MCYIYINRSGFVRNGYDYNMVDNCDLIGLNILKT